MSLADELKGEGKGNDDSRRISRRLRMNIHTIDSDNRLLLIPKRSKITSFPSPQHIAIGGGSKKTLARKKKSSAVVF